MLGVFLYVLGCFWMLLDVFQILPIFFREICLSPNNLYWYGFGFPKFLENISKYYLEKFKIDRVTIVGLSLRNHRRGVSPGITRSVNYSATCPCHPKFSLLTLNRKVYS